MIKKTSVCLCLLALVSSAALAAVPQGYYYGLGGANTTDKVNVAGGYSWNGVYDWAGHTGWVPADGYGPASGEANMVVRATVQTWEQLTLTGNVIDYNVASAGDKSAAVTLLLSSNQGESIYLSDGKDYVTGSGTRNDLEKLTMKADAYGTTAASWDPNRYATTIPMKWEFKIVGVGASQEPLTGPVTIEGKNDQANPGGNDGHTAGIYFNVGDKYLPGSIRAEIKNTITVAANQAPGYYDMDPAIVLSPSL